MDSHSLARFSSRFLNTDSDRAELDHRLGLYRLFLKLYENHPELLDEILELEITSPRSRARLRLQYVQAIVQGQQVQLNTNLLNGKSQLLTQPQGIWVIGRERRSALPISDRRLSRRHAAIQYVANRQSFYLIDLNSTNGSFVNGEPIRHAMQLKNGDQVRLGSLSFTFFICQTVQHTEEIPLELLRQIHEAHAAAIATSEAQNRPDTVAPALENRLAPPPGNLEDPSTFLMPSRTTEPTPRPESPHFSASQQADILDRFFDRQRLNNQN